MKTGKFNILPKNPEERFYLFCIIMSVFLALFLTVSISVFFGKPIGADFRFHMAIAESYSRGENALLNEKFISPNMGPYPPLLHFILVPFIKLGLGVQFASVLQAIFYPSALFASVFIFWKRVNIASASFASVLLLSSVAFFDRSMQVIPQAFDMIFFPLAVYFFLEKRNLGFLISMAITIYSHGVFGLLLLASLALYSIKFKMNLKPIISVIAVSAPIIILTLFFLPSYMGSAAMRVQNPQEEMIMANPLFFFEYTGWIPVSLFSVSLFYLFLERKKLDKIDTLLIFWFVVLIVLIPFYPDRFCTYAIVPMCLISSKTLLKILKPYDKRFTVILLLLLFVFAIQCYMGWWNVLTGAGPVKFDVNQ